MYFLKLVLRNSLRHKLRTGLTMLGIFVAILAFGLLRTVVEAWFAGSENASTTRLIILTTSASSLGALRTPPSAATSTEALVASNRPLIWIPSQTCNRSERF